MQKSKVQQVLIKCTNTKKHKDKQQYVRVDSDCATENLCSRCMTDKKLIAIALKKVD